MESDDGELDITSEAQIVPDDDVTRRANSRTANGKQRPRSVRILFGCCNTYARVTMPERIRNGHQKCWRLHCVRCCKLVEIWCDEKV